MDPVASPSAEAPVRPQADPLVGLLLDGRYLLDRALARGGMATVYAGTDTRLDRGVAVKVMHRALADDPEFVARFTREARAAARLSTPEVVAVHDQGTDPTTGLAYLVMEHVRGGTLRDLLRDQGPQAPVRALALLEPVLRALSAAHREGLVHRDVKPENVLLADDGRVKVADFGLARAVEASSLTSMSTMIGTAAYMAPEQVDRPDAAPDPRTDVYAAGIVLFELLTGEPPYGGDSSVAVAYRHVHDDVPPPSSRVPGLPAALDALVQAATRRDPTARPADAAALLGLVQEVRAALADGSGTSDTALLPRQSSGRPPASTHPAPTHPAPTHPAPTHPTRALARPEPEPAPRRRRRRRPVALLVALAAVLALAGGWWVGARTVPVPDVVRAAQATAEQRLEAEGFTVAVEQAFSEDVPAGSVVEQDPRGRARPGAEVVLVLSKGPDRRALPDLVGLTQEVATQRVEAVGLRVGTVTRAFSDAPAGEVVAMGAKPGRQLRPGSPVNLTVSKGVELLPVPSTVGDGGERAQAALEAAGFAVEVERVFSEDVERGRVVAQDPVGGELRRGGTVTLQVSLGPERIEVPDLGGLSDAEARAALEARGLQGRGVQPPLFGGDRVSRQDPSAGERVRRGSTVTYLLT